ncbi:MAG: hypothetical protein Kow0063_38540 [Anaerolineae bacterium]
MALLLAMSAHGLVTSPARVYADSPSGENEPGSETRRPFRLPFAEPPGPDTWLIAQPYGNTTGAYYQRHSLYGASGGIHFGVDLAAPCGTEIVAIADGVVFAVDGPYGSAPHNLMIDHPQLGYASMYGHLLEAPDLQPGQEVKAGEVIALVGDSDGNCHRRPHLHLEIRDLRYHARKYNPAALIEANWDSLALVGDAGRTFMRDLAEPRKWQTLYTQPEVWTGGPIINDFADTWPLDWSKRESSLARLPGLAKITPAPTQTIAVDPASWRPAGKQITRGDCCTQPYWDHDSTEVRFIDQPGPDAALGVWGVDLTQPEGKPHLVTQRLAVYSPDGTMLAYPDRNRGLAIIERLEDGQRWEVDTQGHGVSFTPDSQRLIWVTYDEDEAWDTREETLWLADLDGKNARPLFSAQRTDLVAWLSDDELLMVRSFEETSDVQLFKLSLTDGLQTLLKTGPGMRGLALSPDRRRLVYYVRFEPDASQNGVWLMDVQDLTQAPEKLPFFGAYRWRDRQHLIYVPFDPEATSHDFYEYNVLTGHTRPLFPSGTNLTIANNDWQVSPDGRKIALVAARGTALDGIWVLNIASGPTQKPDLLVDKLKK